jgi:hypothetical protein
LSVSEKFYQCEAKKLFLRSGTKRWEWVLMPVDAAVQDGVTEFRCKDCHGAVRLHTKTAPPHTEHKSKQDSEYCPSGVYFGQNPGREPRISAVPVP